MFDLKCTYYFIVVIPNQGIQMHYSVELLPRQVE